VDQGVKLRRRSRLVGVPRSQPRPQPLQWRVFLASQAIQAGLLTPDALRGSAWQRLLRGVYADSRLDPDHQVRCQAAMLLAPPEAVIAGASAAYLHGIESAVGDRDPVQLLVERKHRFGPIQGLQVHTSTLPVVDVTTQQQLRCTTALRTAWDVALWRDLVRAVPVLDAMLRSRLVSTGDLAKLVVVRRAEVARGVARAMRAFGLADGRAQSPPESSLRVRLILRGLPPPVPQHPVTVRSGRVLHPDLAWPEYQVALEYEGARHAEPDRLHLDRYRLNALVDAGWLVLHATSRHLGAGFPGLVADVRRALRSRGAPI
jgi:hypothetical protein